jgi:O-antigen/teichoic acid export membrane protein
LNVEFKNIFKNTGIIGLSQVILIIVTVIRSKITALLLGSEGMGIIYLISNSLGVIGTITNLGFGTIALKNIAKAHLNDGQNKIPVLIRHYQIVSWITGLFGLFLTIILAYFLSIYVFNSENYVLEFIFLSSTVLMAQINTGYFTALQGLQKFKLLAYSNIVAGIISLLFAFLIMFFLEKSGIILLVFSYSLIPMLISIGYFRRLNINKTKINVGYIKVLFVDLIKNGTIISLTRFLPLLISMILFYVLTKFGSNKIVGLYSAGFSIIFNYANLLFNSMESEYFTRINKYKSNEELKNAVGFQTELIISFISPIIIFFIIFIDDILILLYSREFLDINQMMKIAIVGLLFKGLSWPLNYLYLIDNKTKKYFTIELASNLVLLILNIIFFIKFDLLGLGYSFLFSQILISLILFYLVAKDFKINISRRLLSYLFIQFLLCSLTLLISISDYFSSINYWLFLICIFYNIWYLNKTIKFRDLAFKVYSK